jgi:hypothetical protein
MLVRNPSHIQLCNGCSTCSMLYASPLYQVKAKVVNLQGQLPIHRPQRLEDLTQLQPAALYVEAKLHTPEEMIGLETKTTYAESLQDGCLWNEWLTFCVKVRPPSVYLLSPFHPSPSLLHIPKPNTSHG